MIATEHELLGADAGRAHVRFTARAGGVGHGDYATLNLGPWTADDPDVVAANRDRLRSALGLRELVGVRQVHGTTVVEAASAAAPGAAPPDADGLTTAQRLVGCLVLTADCLPVALLHADRVAVLHAGWQGLAGGVLEAGVAALGGPADVVAVLGPSAGSCCYEVDTDVGTRFGLPPGKQLLDLKAVATERLRAAGIEEVADVGGCTMHEPEFFSHRRDGPVTGRQGAVAWLS